MTNTVGFRPKLLPPKDRLLERSYRPVVTCLTVSGCITVLVCVVFGLTAFNIYSHRFGPTTHAYHSGDEMSMLRASQDLSATFCSAYKVYPDGRTEFYLLPREAEIDSKKNVNMTFTLTASVPGPFVKNEHYFLVNSSLRLSACFENLTSDLLHAQEDHHSAKFLVIIGDNHFHEWRKHFNPRHVKYTVPIPRNASCGNLTASATLTLTVPQSDNYHFVLLPRGSRRKHPVKDDATLTAAVASNAKLVLTGVVNKTQFNVSGAVSVCNASEKLCTFVLPWGSHRDIVAKVLPVFQDPDASAAFTTRCVERLEFWLPVFVALPVLILVLMWGWCWCLLVKRRGVRSRYVAQRLGESSRSSGGYGSFSEERDPLITTVSPPPQSLPGEGGEGHIEESDERCASIQG
ncbi:uncharacterized protein LOC143275369 [Babylonia areolata]|uniref:uncharacterized protein LOC143275369 n=1 Tax=Babylonia areolata TaxID=304850 RepID=UPI003FCFA334